MKNKNDGLVKWNSVFGIFDHTCEEGAGSGIPKVAGRGRKREKVRKHSCIQKEHNIRACLLTLFYQNSGAKFKQRCTYLKCYRD